MCTTPWSFLSFGGFRRVLVAWTTERMRRVWIPILVPLVCCLVLTHLFKLLSKVIHEIERFIVNWYAQSFLPLGIIHQHQIFQLLFHQIIPLLDLFFFQFLLFELVLKMGLLLYLLLCFFSYTPLYTRPLSLPFVNVLFSLGLLVFMMDLENLTEFRYVHYVSSQGLIVNLFYRANWLIRLICKTGCRLVNWLSGVLNIVVSSPSVKITFSLAISAGHWQILIYMLGPSRSWLLLSGW